MINCYKYIIIFFVFIVASATLNQDSNYVNATVVNTSTFENIYSTPCNGTSTAGKLPKPIKPIKKKQTSKRSLVSKRVPVSEAIFTFNIQSVYNNILCCQQLILPHPSLISGYQQALISHSSLYYLY